MKNSGSTIDIYQLFIDFKQTYDSIDRNKLFAIMLDFNIHPKLVRLVRCTLQNTRCQVKIVGKLTGAFEVSQGLKQGDGLAPILFNLALGYAIKKSRSILVHHLWINRYKLLDTRMISTSLADQ